MFMTTTTNNHIRTIDGIPVRNLWLLLLYASRYYKENPEKITKSVEDNPDDIPNLVAEILTHHVEHRIRRSLTHGYQDRKSIMTRVRGRINHFSTERMQLLDKGKIACQFQEISVNTIRNRLVKAALESISKLVKNNVQLARKCRVLATILFGMGVIGERPSRGDVSIDRLGRNDTSDLPMVSVAKLALDLALPSEDVGSQHLASPNKNSELVRKIFEKGVAGFYDVVLSSQLWSVNPGRKIYWPVDKFQESSGIDAILPSMQVDIILDNLDQTRRIVIDTKFTSITSKGWRKDETLRSKYIYQIYAYLRSQEKNDDQLSINSTGILLHPAIGESVDEAVVIQGHEIRFATVDLGSTASEIRSQLLNIVEKYQYQP